MHNYLNLWAKHSENQKQQQQPAITPPQPTIHLVEKTSTPQKLEPATRTGSCSCYYLNFKANDTLFQAVLSF